MRDHLAEHWRATFEHNGLRIFDDFWARQIAWFEKPNFRRGGWSGVGRWELSLPQGGSVAVFVKRQEDHVTRTWRHPFRGMATLRREFENVLQFQRFHLPAPGLLYFGERKVEGHLRAMLVTEELKGFRSLEAWTEEWAHHGWPPLAARRQWIGAIASVVRQMHARRFQHNCLYAKHVFVKAGNSGGVDVRLIDLEKARRCWWRRLAVYRDLDTLHRHTPGWRVTDRVRFINAYLGGSNGRRQRQLWRALIRLSRRKPG
jgi:hypothetical protein